MNGSLCCWYPHAAVSLISTDVKFSTCKLVVCVSGSRRWSQISDIRPNEAQETLPLRFYGPRVQDRDRDGGSAVSCRRGEEMNDAALRAGSAA